MQLVVAAAAAAVKIRTVDVMLEAEVGAGKEVVVMEEVEAMAAEGEEEEEAAAAGVEEEMMPLHYYSLSWIQQVKHKG